MCNICLDYQKGLLTWNEAWANAHELSDKEHYEDVTLMLIDDAGNDFNDLFEDGED